VAIQQARQEMIRMGEIALEMMKDVIASLEPRSTKAMNKWQKKEDAIDMLQKEITNYLVQVSQGDISLSQSKELSSLLRMTNNIERIGDSVENIAELIEEMIDNDIKLSPEGVRDYKEISGTTIEFLEYLLENLHSGSRNVMDKSRELEESIDLMREEMRGNHLMRLRNGTCTIDPGLIFTDMLNHFEKIGDYSFNVAQAMAGIK
jgi:phosphate:Na+ symporter